MNFIDLLVIAGLFMVISGLYYYHVSSEVISSKPWLELDRNDLQIDQTRLAAIYALTAAQIQMKRDDVLEWDRGTYPSEWMSLLGHYVDHGNDKNVSGSSVFSYYTHAVDSRDSVFFYIKIPIDLTAIRKHEPSSGLNVDVRTVSNKIISFHHIDSVSNF